MLYSRRKRLRERAEAESKGQSFWTESFNEKIRTRLFYIVGDVAGNDLAELLERARRLILKDEGGTYLHGYGPSITPAADFHDHFVACSDQDFPTAIEALYAAMPSFSYGGGPGYAIPRIHADEFASQVHELLEEERIAFDFVSGQMVSFKSKELHQHVIEPAMTLLHDPQFSAAEKAYQDALEEVTRGKPGDAITDAGTALQETLTALNCRGDSLGPLIKSAKSRGLFAAHDARMTQMIEDAMQWVAADRSEKGDSHKADAAEKDDAWFIIHVVGALIVRLVSASRR